MTTTTCQHEARGKYPIVAVGWVGWRLKDELVFNGEKARRWYVWIENFPRKEREGWGTLNAGIASQTYSTILSQCDASPSTTTKRESRLTRSDRLLRDWRASARAEIPDNADELQTPEQRLSRAKAAVPDHLKDKIMSVGDTLIVPVGDDD
ncbi:unnamed protein product [Rhizoctonia solani]|nr:unnamed protein product [Rhizoctonia solani]